jgi:hypothetical protein
MINLFYNKDLVQNLMYQGKNDIYELLYGYQKYGSHVQNSKFVWVSSLIKRQRSKSTPFGISNSLSYHLFKQKFTKLANCF